MLDKTIINDNSYKSLYMPEVSKKKVPSKLDLDVWRMALVEHRTREDIAKTLGKSIVAVDYHIAEAKRLVGIDVSQVKSEFQHLLVPVAIDSLRLIHKAFKSGSLKHLDAAIKFLRNAGYTIEQQEVTHVLKDQRNADEDFNAVMQRFKSNAIDAESSDPGASNDEQGELPASTPTSDRDADK